MDRWVGKVTERRRGAGSLHSHLSLPLFVPISIIPAFGIDVEQRGDTERVSEEIERRDRGKGLLPRSSASFITRKAFPYPFPIASPCNTFGVTSRDWVRHEGKGKESLLYHSPFPSLSSHPLGSLTANINSRTKMGWREDGKR